MKTTNLVTSKSTTTDIAEAIDGSHVPILQSLGLSVEFVVDDCGKLIASHICVGEEK
jgi:hypothetical protein